MVNIILARVLEVMSDRGLVYHEVVQATPTLLVEASSLTLGGVVLDPRPPGPGGFTQL